MQAEETVIVQRSFASILTRDSCCLPESRLHFLYIQLLIVVFFIQFLCSVYNQSATLVHRLLLKYIFYACIFPQLVHVCKYIFFNVIQVQVSARVVILYLCEPFYSIYFLIDIPFSARKLGCAEVFLYMDVLANL